MLLRSIATVGGYTLLSRIVGFLRDLFFAAMLGAVRLEAFGHVDTVFAVPAVHFAAPTEIAGRQGVDLRPGPSAR